MIEKSLLVREYLNKKKSVSDIAKSLGCAENTINYWLNKHGIKKRTISEAIYQKNNPTGDPFSFSQPKSSKEWFLYGLGLGLYWGEGNKANKHAVRLGNTDPELLLKFIVFLKKIYCVDAKKLRFGIQLFQDCDENEALNYWSKKLKVSKSQFYKTVITPSRKKGTYRKKNPYGVVTVYFSNVKLRDSIVSAIEELRTNK